MYMGGFESESTMNYTDKRMLISLCILLFIVVMLKSINGIWEFLKYRCDDKLILVNSTAIYKYLHFHLHNRPAKKEDLYVVRDILDLMATMSKYEGGTAKQMRGSLYTKLY